jgi:hypothetical protein
LYQCSPNSFGWAVAPADARQRFDCCLIANNGASQHDCWSMTCWVAVALWATGWMTRLTNSSETACGVGVYHLLAIELPSNICHRWSVTHAGLICFGDFVIPYATVIIATYNHCFSHCHLLIFPFLSRS